MTWPDGPENAAICLLLLSQCPFINRQQFNDSKKNPMYFSASLNFRETKFQVVTACFVKSCMVDSL